MKNQNIICFAKDWQEDPTSNNHIMLGLSKHNKVLWLNSLAARNPKLTSGRDISKIFLKLRSAFSSLHRVNDNMTVFTPLVAPYPYSRLAQFVNRIILRLMLGRLRRKLGMKHFQLWTFLPTSEPYVGHMGEDFSVFYCTDESSQFTSSDTRSVVDMERKLCRKADLVFATAQSLVDKRLEYNPNTVLARHGVDYHHFAKALDDSISPPADVSGLKGPVLGFFGLIHDWIDLELLEEVARRRPNWNIVLIGNSLVPLGTLPELPNVLALGRKPYDELPAYCSVFDVGIIPFKVNELTRHVNPIKLREYLSAGLPVVSTPMDEVSHFAPDCRVAGNVEGFIEACEDALSSEDSRDTVSARMANQTWDAVIDAVGKEVTQRLG
ncbi:MAG: glycosyltransferase [Xanthomonadales bacterium]|nr:glycosyltransferase [Xanthomonadales bacterium]